MGQKFSEFKKSFKMRSRRESSRQSSKKHSDDPGSDVHNGNFHLNQSSNSDNNGNVPAVLVSNFTDESDFSRISACDNRVAEENGNRVSPLMQDPGAQTSASSHVYSAPNVGMELCSKLTLNPKSDTGQKKLQKLGKEASSSNINSRKSNHWVLKFNYSRLISSNSSAGTSDSDVPATNLGCDACVCIGYQRHRSYPSGADFEIDNIASVSTEDSRCFNDDKDNALEPVIDLAKFKFENYPIEDYDERARKERAREIAEGVEPPPGYKSHIHLVNPEQLLSSALDSFTALLHSAALTALSQFENSPQAHTQVDYMHCLVPDILQITSCSFYWGKMDRYEAERLLEGLPEGAFLLRDSAQEEYLFSVSFRKYSRSLHARIEQWNHLFSFDCRDPGVYASSTVCGLIEHYKNLSCCMFFEPQLTIPLHRNFPFPLQHLCRATICSLISYDGINQLKLPKMLKSYLKEYHYKQRLRVRVLDPEQGHSMSHHSGPSPSDPDKEMYFAC